MMGLKIGSFSGQITSGYIGLEIHLMYDCVNYTAQRDEGALLRLLDA